MIAEKRIALTHRANKLIEWLQRYDYAIYAGHESTTQLIKVTDLIIWTLERSIPRQEWDDFDFEFKGTRLILDDIFNDVEAERNTYNIARLEIIATLRSYLEFIATKDIDVIYQD